VLEKPDIHDDRIIACLGDEYGLNGVEVTFLPLGADQHTAVYRAVAHAGPAYFVKLRQGAFDKASVALPRFLSDQGIAQIIAPLETQNGTLWASLDAFKLILYPFVQGVDGYEVNLSEHQWEVLGRALKRIHTTTLPAALRRAIRQEHYAPWARDGVKAFLEDIERGDLKDPVAARLARFLRSRREEVLDLVSRAERLAHKLRTWPIEPVLCHSDLHAGNVLVASDGALYIVDWDEPILAPRERDLMYAGGGLMGGWRTPEEEETFFYRGYGQVYIDPFALAYYRYERIVLDIVAYCEQLLLTDDGGQDREQSLRYLMSSFEPGGVLEIAYRSDRTLD
jgi:spectinomycin phosphotransferase